MTQEDKELLLKDLCARLPYNTHIFTSSKHHIRLLTISTDIDYDEQFWINGLYDIDEVKPYLRPMSSIASLISAKEFTQLGGINLIDWYNANHIDYRGLIPKGLAIAVTKENNPYKE